MPINLIDDQYEKREINHTRQISRGIAVNDYFEVAILHLKRNDIFGDFDFYELPGGGVKEDENYVQAFEREMKEELGASVENIFYIDTVSDYYNLINRHNVQHYFYCHITKLEKQELEPYEQKIISEVLYVNIDEAIRLFSEMASQKGLPTLVSRRELPILKQFKHLVKEKSLLNDK